MTFVFYDDELTAVQLASGAIFVPARPLCDNLGLSWFGQRERIRRSEILNDAILGVRVTRPPGRGDGTQEMLCLPLDLVPGYRTLPLESFPAVMDWLTEWWQQVTDELAPFAAGE